MIISMAHIGSNISRLRRFKDIPQKAMADRLKMSQQDYSRLEQKQEIDDDLLDKVARALEVTVEDIRQADGTTTIQTVYQNEGNKGNGFNINNNDIIIELYERIIAEKDVTIASLQQVIDMYKQQNKSA